MNVRKATKDYERWVGTHTEIYRPDLRFKHERMSDPRDPLPFLRATYYRWCELFPQVCAELADAPVVPAVGDMHMENFGTWRDAESRPAWGVNDLDEADVLPYTNDLVRLAVSLRLEGAKRDEAPSTREMAEALLAGYGQSIEAGGPSTLLSDGCSPLSDVLGRSAANPDRFWKKLDKQSVGDAASLADVAVKLALEDCPPGVRLRFQRRRAGLGSLGRPRFAGTGRWAGARVIRELKARVPAATVWLGGQRAGPGDDLQRRILAAPNRSSDPTLRFGERWIVRRLAPDAIKIELEQLTAVDDWTALCRAMGREVASVHLSVSLSDGNPRTRIKRDLTRRGGSWLRDAAKRMAEATLGDWRAWQK